MKTYKDYCEHLKKIADVSYAAAILNWDQEVMMPKKGVFYRAQQRSTLAGIVHDYSTNSDYGQLLKRLINDKHLTEEQHRNVIQSFLECEKEIKFDVAFVKKMNSTISMSFQAWQEARATNNFELFAPHLEKIISLQKEQTEILGYENHPYDALLDIYEPGLTTMELEDLFHNIRGKLVTFVKEITNAAQVDDSVMFKYWDKDKQWEFGLFLLKNIGFDLEAGRQDISTHPFTTNFNSRDVRLTTRINDNNFNEMTWSCIHECGHGLYEQGLKADNYGLPAGEYVSLGIHESQSRLWENNVGRGMHFWQSNYPELQKRFPENLKDVSIEKFYKAMNIVKPGLIRTEADELTYHFHIMIRFEIEKALIEGKLSVNQLPQYWNDKYKEYLGIDVPNNKVGVLQDIHWSHGSFGYFPTYTLGSFYASQFFSQAKKDIPDIEEEIAQGNNAKLLLWLRENIHQHGRLFNAREICIKVTGEPLNPEIFFANAFSKYRDIYNL